MKLSSMVDIGITFRFVFITFKLPYSIQIHENNHDMNRSIKNGKFGYNNSNILTESLNHSKPIITIISRLTNRAHKRPNYQLFDTCVREIYPTSNILPPFFSSPLLLLTPNFNYSAFTLNSSSCTNYCYTKKFKSNHTPHLPPFHFTFVIIIRV